MPSPTARHPDLLAHRDAFPLLARSTYLNTCSLGARSRRSRELLDRVLDEWDELGARAWYRRWLGLLDELRADVGAIVGVPGNEITLAPNVSAALAVIASALDPVHRGDPATATTLAAAGIAADGRPRNRVVTTSLDFPTLGHQWLAREALGVELIVVPSPDGTTVPLESFADAVDDRTALVATGHVYFTTGARVHLRPLADLCHDRGALLLVDAYQATGIVPTDLASSGVDVYVSGTLKWLFGGTGMAFGWVRPELHEALRPTTTGWFSSARQFAFAVDELAFAEGGRRYELGTPSIPSAAIAKGGTELVRSVGVEPLGERTGDLGDRVVAGARSIGLASTSPPRAADRGGIVAVRVADPKPVVDALAEERIIVDFRPGVVRCSPAFYNTEEEVDGLIERLDALVPRSDRVT
jgi:kynureninase